jgi:hypothetical protein
LDAYVLLDIADEERARREAEAEVTRG